MTTLIFDGITLNENRYYLSDVISDRRVKIVFEGNTDYFYYFVNTDGSSISSPTIYNIYHLGRTFKGDENSGYGFVDIIRAGEDSTVFSFFPNGFSRQTVAFMTSVDGMATPSADDYSALETYFDYYDIRENTGNFRPATQIDFSSMEGVTITQNDKIVGAAGRDVFRSGDGRDQIDAYLGNDIVHAGRGDDVVYGNDGNDRLNGNAGNDILNGQEGRDVVAGNRGNDWIAGNAGDDKLDGGLGADKIFGGYGDDIARGGSGFDNISGNQGSDTLFGDAGADILSGNEDSDRLHGGRGDDFIAGNFGDDFLNGNLGADDLFGGVGRDILDGGLGDDELSGGSGADVFVYRKDYGVDEVEDFSDAQDMLHIDGDLMRGGAAETVRKIGQVDGDDLILAFGGGNRIELEDYMQSNDVSDLYDNIVVI
ncbi:calcium-binding protein [Paracoccaceae bacterium GXU_MW_L88]